jgi:hypothetical protein
MGFFDWARGKTGAEVAKDEPKRERPRQFSTDLPLRKIDREGLFANLFAAPVFKDKESAAVVGAMDTWGDSGNPYTAKGAFTLATQQLPDSLMSWYANQGFIGYQACAIFAQQWLVSKACSMPAKDAVRNGWKATINNGEEESVELMEKIKQLDKHYKVHFNLVELITKKRVFGIRIAIFVVDSDDEDYYLKPFNIDGITEGSYKGISQVDPYWMTPLMGEDSIQNPAGMNFYEPTWWQIGGKRYHRSHLIIVRHGELADLIKPAYLYGGVPLTQQIYERIYAAERTANEAPLLAMTKRMNVIKAELDQVFANPERFMERMAEQSALRDNYGTRLIGTDEEYTQHETSLADLDATIMTQYQLVSAIAEVPSTKLLGTSPKGFGASGDYEVASYNEFLAGLQTTDGTPFLERHYALMNRSDLGGKYHIEPVWNPFDEPTETELAAINKTKADTYVALQNTGAIDGTDIAEVLVKDPQSGFSGATSLGSENTGDELEEGDGEDQPAKEAE